jgi:hypothetical protein
MNKLEEFAKYGNVDNGGLGRDALIGVTKIGTAKYTYKGPYKNSEITGDVNGQYGATHTNAIADATSPYNGKGTGQGYDVTAQKFAAIENYNGGSYEDINGAIDQIGSGRKAALINNNATWGYGPKELGFETYKQKAPTISSGGGQRTIV